MHAQFGCWSDYLAGAEGNLNVTGIYQQIDNWNECVSGKQRLAASG
jgi:hypothetical protein